MGQPYQRQRTSAGLKLPVFRLDDRNESPRQRGLPHGQEARLGLPDAESDQRARIGAVHQAACVSQRLGRYFEGITAISSDQVSRGSPMNEVPDSRYAARVGMWQQRLLVLWFFVFTFL